MKDKISYNIDVKSLCNDIHRFRNDYQLQKLLSDFWKKESIEESVLWAEKQIKSRGLMFTLINGRFAGTTKLYKLPTNNYQNVYDVGIALMEEFRGMGFGKKTLQYRLASLGEGDIVLTTILKSNQPSMALFKSCGFKCADPLNYQDYQTFSNEWVLVELKI